MMRATVLVLFLASAGSAIQGAQDNSAASSIWSGVYSEAQAQRGKAAFETHCARCHFVDLNGSRTNPPLHGEKFLSRWRNTSVDNLFRKIRDTMPDNYPETVAEDTKLDILTYLLQQNDFPAGPTELKLGASNIESIQIVKKGENGVPNFAFVEIVGCLAQVSDQAWTLANATEPAMLKEEPATATELKNAQAKPLGTLTFLLVNANAFKPELRLGRRVEAMGLLYRQPGENRINLTSLQTVSANCSN
jgi:mono/diheme cytochrome c family protein